MTADPDNRWGCRRCLGTGREVTSHPLYRGWRYCVCDTGRALADRDAGRPAGTFALIDALRESP
jgi:hypothetical protein